MGWNYLSIPKLQRCNRWSLGMDKQFHPTLFWARNYLSMLGLKLNHVSKRGHSKATPKNVHMDWLYDHIKINHNKTVHIFHGIYFLFKQFQRLLTVSMFTKQWHTLYDLQHADNYVFSLLRYWMNHCYLVINIEQYLILGRFAVPETSKNWLGLIKLHLLCPPDAWNLRGTVLFSGSRGVLTSTE